MARREGRRGGRGRQTPCILGPDLGSRGVFRSSFGSEDVRAASRALDRRACHRPPRCAAPPAPSSSPSGSGSTCCARQTARSRASCSATGWMMSPSRCSATDELVHATLWVSQYGHVDLARQCLQEMSRRAMRPSLDAHNAVLKALALQHKWSTATHVLLRMEQHELEPDATSYAAVLRSTRGRPGSARFGRRLLEEAEGASGVGAAAGSDGVGRGGILAAARGEAAASAAAAGGAELQDAWSAVVASDPLEGDPREGLRLLQVRLARGAGSSEETYPRDRADVRHASQGAAPRRAVARGAAGGRDHGGLASPHRPRRARRGGASAGDGAPRALPRQPRAPRPAAPSTTHAYISPAAGIRGSDRGVLAGGRARGARWRWSLGCSRS